MALVKPVHPEASMAETLAQVNEATRVTDLASPDPAVRRRRIRALLARPGTVAVLSAHLAREQNLSVRSLILTGLIANRSPEVAAALLPLLNSEDANLRCGAIEALQEMPDEVAPHVESLLADPDSDIRIFAVNLVAVLAHPRVPAWLHQVVTTDPHVNVCAAALDALSEVGEPECIPAVQSLLTRFPDVAFITFAVDVAIRRIRGPIAP